LTAMGTAQEHLSFDIHGTGGSLLSLPWVLSKIQITDLQAAD